MHSKLTSNLTILTLTLAFSSFSHAELISVGWKTAGDKLITRDTATGLDWLDLTETNLISRDTILMKLGTDKTFAGWKYATAEQVNTLWLNGGVDLTKSAQKDLKHEDPKIAIMTSFLGNIMHDYQPISYPHGVIGIINEPVTDDSSEYKQIGAFYFSYPNKNYYHGLDTKISASTESSREDFGHYLIKKSPTPKTIKTK